MGHLAVLHAFGMRPTAEKGETVCGLHCRTGGWMVCLIRDATAESRGNIH